MSTAEEGVKEVTSSLAGNTLATESDDTEFGIAPSDEKNRIDIIGLKKLDGSTVRMSFRKDTPKWDDKSLGLSEEIQKACLLSLKWKGPSQMQACILQLMQEQKKATTFMRQSIGISAKFGTGKTGAFALPVITQIDASKDDLQAVILSPTNVLTKQIYGVFLKMVESAKPKIRCAVVAKAEERGTRFEDMVRNRPHIVIATSGSMKGALRYKAVDTSKVKLLVLDEADDMLDKQRQNSLDLRKKMSKAQCILVSATLPDPTGENKDKDSLSDEERRREREILKYMPKFTDKTTGMVLVREIKDPVKIKQRVKKFFLKCDGQRKKFEFIPDLMDLGKDFGSLIVFCNRKSTLKQLSQYLKEEHKFTSSVLHGDLDQKEQGDAVKKFRENKVKMLLTTDILAQGFDVQLVRIVVNLDIPEYRGNAVVHSYQHRCGRTARGEHNNGIVINLIDTTRNQFTIMKECEKIDPSPSEELDTEDPFTQILDFFDKNKKQMW
mmetsp:Transcript_25058/g.34919  ORF Transcript_25058/g.34919 Transcript_25058/m.34919 type:complete len:495 (+) Transcript_25058:69-1553(+)